MEEQAAGMSVRPEDKAFIANVYKYAFVGLMLDWIKHDIHPFDKKLYNFPPGDKNFITGHFLLMALFRDL